MADCQKARNLFKFAEMAMKKGIRLSSDEDSQSSQKMTAITICKTAFDWSDIANCQRHLFREGFVSVNHITDTDDIELIRTELL